MIAVAAGSARRHGAHASIPVLLGVVLIGLFSGLLLGSIRVSSLARSALAPLAGEKVTFELVVTGPVRTNSGWQSANALVVREQQPRSPASAKASPRGDTVSLELPPPSAGGAAEAPFPVLAQGQRLTVSGTLRAPAGPSASGFDEATFLQRQGISVVLEAAAGGVTVIGTRGGVAGWFDRLRSGARDHLSRGPDVRVGEMLQGVVMADKEGIDEGWLEAFRRSGTAHMLAVNGLHVGSLAALILMLARWCRLPRGVGFLLAACAALFMVPFTGASPSVVRASTMIVIVLLGRWLGRRRDQWQVLASRRRGRPGARTRSRCSAAAFSSPSPLSPECWH
jgi:predicted membrane metal-binding protein